jgi:hypothetical protein
VPTARVTVCAELPGLVDWLLGWNRSAPRGSDLWPDQVAALSRVAARLANEPTEDDPEHRQAWKPSDTLVRVNNFWTDVAYLKARGPRGPAGRVLWPPKDRELITHARYVCQLAVAARPHPDEVAAALERLLLAANIMEAEWRLGGGL